MTKEPEAAKEYNKSATAISIFIKATLLSLGFAFVMLLITALGVAFWGFNKLNNFTKAADTSIVELKNTVIEGLNTPVTQTNFKKNILLLGLDSLEGRPGSPALTDTIMLLSVDLKTGKIATISLPRDLWSEEYITRINALYYYGQDKYPSEPERFAKEVIQDLTGVEIHHTLVMSIDTVAQIIDILGGVEVDVEQGFTDTQFPRPNVDVTKVKDPDLLYQTISFDEGLQNMDGQRALQFIRSRKSGDDQGDDLARSARQQKIINSLIIKLKNFNFLENLDQTAQLYKFYNQNFANQISIEQAIATGKTLLTVLKTISFSSNAISVFPEDEFGVITNPPTWKYKGEWVYEIRNINLFQQEILNKLELNPQEKTQ